MVFRGFVMHSLHRLLRAATHDRTAWTLALLLTAVLFGAGHAYQGIAGALIVGAIAMSEPAAGSDLQGIQTTAVRDGDALVRSAGSEGTAWCSLSWS